MDNTLNKALVLGDSIFKGVIYDESEGRYITTKPCVENILEDLDYSVDNHSSFGMTTSRLLTRLDRYVSEDKGYKTAVIELGGNDCDFNWKEVSLNPTENHLPKVEINQFKINLLKIISQLLFYKIKPVIVTMAPISSNRFLNWFGKDLNKENILKWLKDENYIYKYHELYNLELLKFAAKFNLQVIDLRKSLLELRNYEEYLCIDGVHLNKAGHRFVEKEFTKQWGIN